MNAISCNLGLSEGPRELPHSISPYPPYPLDAHNLAPTVNVGWDLPKDGEVRVVDDPTKDPIHPALVVDEDGLLGHSEGHHPHRQEKEEEEDVLHL